MEERIRSRRSIKKKKKGIISKLIVLIVLVAIIICSIIFISRTINNVKQYNKILGSWTTDGYTVYEFYEKNKGALVLPIATYDFTYKIEENRVYIDFQNEKSIDSDYEFSFKNEKMILKGINKTSGTYTFTKNEK